MKDDNLNTDREKVYDDEVLKKDRSLLYMGIGLGIIILVMGYFTFFVDEPDKFFSKNTAEEPAAGQPESKAALLEENADMSDEDVRQSLVKFVEAFYYDQRKGYFDPPSYFANITQTYYNYHNLTHKRLRDIHSKLMMERENLTQNWIVSSLDFEHKGPQLLVTYWAKIEYYKPSTGTQESANVKNEMIINEEGKIISLKELETKTLYSYIVIREPDSNAVTLPTDEPQNAQTAAAQAEKTEALYEGKLYDQATVETAPEYYGGPEVLNNYLAANIRYPRKARRKKIEGQVQIGFVVEKDGKLSNLRVISGIGFGCDEEALRVLSNSPAWKPGYAGGRAVRTSYILPVEFKLKK